MLVGCSGSGLGDHEHISGFAGRFRAASGCDARPGLRINRARCRACQACTHALHRRIPGLRNYRLKFIFVSDIRQYPNVNQVKTYYLYEGFITFLKMSRMFAYYYKQSSGPHTARDGCKHALITLCWGSEIFVWTRTKVQRK